MTIICLTGGIASGKSTAAEYLKDQGAHVINADLLGHQAYLPGTQAYKEVIETFGVELVDNDEQINRKVLGSKVFGNPDALKRLTDIVWPEIRRLAESEISNHASSHPDQIIVLEAAVLFEAGWEDIGDEIWTVTVDPAIAIQRASKRDNIDAESVKKRIESQLTNEERVKRSDIVIKNDSTLSQLTGALEQEWKRLSTGKSRN